MTADHDAEHRDNFVRALEACAAFLRDHPDVPVPGYTSDILLHVNDPSEVDRIATLLGVEPAWNQTRTHYQAERVFGEPGRHRDELARGITLAALYITPDRRARSEAASSYHDAVEPE